jgi:hypothetical protein
MTYRFVFPKDSLVRHEDNELVIYSGKAPRPFFHKVLELQPGDEIRVTVTKAKREPEH